MEPKNKEERKKAFINFLLLFILCIAIILTTVFFSVRVPFSENEKFRAKIELNDRESAFSKKFTNQLKGLSSMLDSINRISPQESMRLDGRIESEINKLDALLTDNVYNNMENKELYAHVVHNLRNQLECLKEVRSKSDKDLDINNLKSQLEKANESARDYYAQYVACTQALLKK